MASEPNEINSDVAKSEGLDHSFGQSMVITIRSADTAYHPELIEKSHLAPPAGVLSSCLDDQSLDLANGLYTGFLRELDPNEEQTDNDFWRTNERVDHDLILEEIIEKTPSDQSTKDSSFDSPKWLAELLNKLDEKTPKHVSRREIVRAALRLGNAIIESRTNPGAMVGASSGLRNMKTDVDEPGLNNFSLSLNIEYDFAKRDKISYNVDDYVDKNLQKLSAQFNLKIRQVVILFICVGLAKSQTISDTAGSDKVETIASSGLSEIDRTTAIGEIQYEALLQYLGTHCKLSRKQVRRMFRSIHETYEMTQTVVPLELWARMWMQAAIIDPVPVYGAGRIL